MASNEINQPGKPANKPGYYQHPDTGSIVHVRQHPKLGSAMADGVVAQGYKHIGDELPKEKAPKTETNKTEK